VAPHRGRTLAKRSTQQVGFKAKAILLYAMRLIISPVLGEAEYNAAQAKEYVEGVTDRVTGLYQHPKRMAAS
jgi:hypothetical protein